MATAADPRYDLAGALQTLLPGIVVQRQLLDAAAAQYQANGFTPLTAAQALACLTAANALDQWNLPARVPATTVGTYPAGLPPYPTTLPRFEDSNPDPFDGWVEFPSTSVPPT